MFQEESASRYGGSGRCCTERRSRSSRNAYGPSYSHKACPFSLVCFPHGRPFREPPSEVDLDLFRRLTSNLVKSEEQEELKPPDGTRGRILTAKAFKLKQQSPRERRPATSADPDELQVVMPTGEIKRPLHIRLVDVKLIMPLEVRNAVMGVYMHMLSAFTGPPRPASFKEKIADSIPPEQLQERQQKEEEAPGFSSNEQEEHFSILCHACLVLKSTDSQLLKLLLEQNEQGRGPSFENKRSPSVEEQNKVDPLPKRLLSTFPSRLALNRALCRIEDDLADGV